MTNINAEKQSGTIDIASGKSQFWRQIGKLNEGLAFEVFPFKCYPSVAEYLLSTNTFENQRNMSKNTVAVFSNILKAGNFVSGSVIRLARDVNGRWTLTDGQHRLSAIACSGVAAEMVVLFSYDEIHHEYASVDSGGRPRSLRDAHIAYGFEYTKTMPQSNQRRFSSACRMIHADFEFRDECADKLEIGVFSEEFTDQMSLLTQWATRTKVFAHGKHGSMKVPMLAIALATVKHCPVVAEDFWRKAFENDGLGRYDVRRQLHDLIVMPYGGGHAKQGEYFRKTVHLWNLFYMGERDMKTWHGLADEIVCINGTPYPKRLGCGS